MEISRGEYYDIISDPAVRLAHEGEFLLRLLREAPGPRVLDAACGTGVHAEFLAKNGAVVTARDIDHGMLEYARAKRPHENVMYEKGDMRQAAGGPFDLVIIIGNSLSMLPSFDDVRRTVAAVDVSLRPGGIALLHVINYARFRQAGAQQKVARRAVPGGEAVVVKDMVPAEGAGALVSFSYFARSGEGWRSSGHQSVLLELAPAIIEEAAAACGLAVEGRFGDYDRSPFNVRRSPDLLLLLHKAG